MDEEKQPLVSKEDARNQGSKRFFTGVPCKNGHISERNTNSGRCLGCIKEYTDRNKVSLAAYQVEWHRVNRDRQRRYREENKCRIKEKSAEWHRDNKDRVSKISKEWELANKERRRELNKIWREVNKDHVKKKRREHQPAANETMKRRRKEDPSIRLRSSMRNYLKKTLSLLTSDKERGRTALELGYTCEELRYNLEQKFSAGMSWDNYGEWHIDHKEPIHRMVGRGIKDAKIINGFDNLVPMWADHNLSKGSKLLCEWLMDRGESSYEYQLYSRFL